MLPLALILLGAPGRPLFYWGARPATILADAPPARGVEARVTEVHAALDKRDLVVRFTFDRAVKEALYLKDGAPVSGRLRAALDIDADADRATGIASGVGDLRTGADHRVEVGVVALGRDDEEKLPARALVTAALLGLAPRGVGGAPAASRQGAGPRGVAAHPLPGRKGLRRSPEALTAVEEP
jgi:hypothetical protein